ncbi:MAG: AMP-binding protein, partial [Deltaproteobacteria bacterium]|nr:AMP-binding protein [Deltaproteobacteria bacterium]
GYYKNPEATADVFKPWGLRTGDLGYTVAGELYVTGRKKDIIILNGRNYDPQTIEWAVADLEGIRKGNVIAFSILGEQSEDLIVVAECRPGLDEESLKQQVKDAVRGELFLNVEDVVLLVPGGLSKTSSGKLQRSKTRQHYIDKTIATGGSRAMGSRGETITVARHMVRSLMSRVKYTVKERAVAIPVVGRIQDSITKRIRPRV